MTWDDKRTEELRRAIKQVDRPRAKRPLKKNECKRHVFIETDRCHYCGTPQEENA